MKYGKLKTTDENVIIIIEEKPKVNFYYFDRLKTYVPQNSMSLTLVMTEDGTMKEVFGDDIEILGDIDDDRTAEITGPVEEPETDSEG